MRRSPASELLAWTLLGAAIGVAAGFVLGEVLGPVDRNQVKDLLTGGARPGPRLRPAELVRAVRTELRLDSALHPLNLEPLAAGPGIVELHGWVPSRALRTRAVRVASAAPGLDRLINRLLVRGEDDTHSAPGAVTGQPA